MSLLIRFVEKFPKGTIWQTRYLCLPAAIIFATVSLMKSPLAVGLTALYFTLGVLTWTLLEYTVHRFVFHHRPTSALGLALLKRFHIDHHADPKDQLQVCVPPLLLFPQWAMLLGLVLLFGGNLHGSFVYVSGLALMMVIYDIAHFSAHYMPATNRLLQFIKRQHLSHHFASEAKNFGVTTPFWDMLFRSYSPSRNTRLSH